MPLYTKLILSFNNNRASLLPFKDILVFNRKDKRKTAEGSSNFNNRGLLDG
jgi:hypothetical protein